MHKAEPYATGSTKRITMDARWIELSRGLSIAASDVQMGLIRAGTGNGKGWHTKGAGKNRNDVTKNITGLPAWGVVSRIEAPLCARYFLSSALTHHRTGAWPCALPFSVGRVK